MEKEAFVRHFLKQIKDLFHLATTGYQNIKVPISGEVVDRIAGLKLLLEDYEGLLQEQIQKEGANTELALKAKEKPDTLSEEAWRVVEEARKMRKDVEEFQKRVQYTIELNRKQGDPKDKEGQVRARKRRFGPLRGRKDWNPL